MNLTFFYQPVGGVLTGRHWQGDAKIPHAAEKKCWMHNMFRIWLKNRRGAAPTNSCPPRKTGVASEGSDSRHPLLEERTAGPAFTRSLLGRFQPRTSGGAARGLSDSSHGVRIPPMSHSWDFFVCLLTFFLQHKTNKSHRNYQTGPALSSPLSFDVSAEAFPYC